MAINLFKSKKSSLLKRNTIKKAEPVDGRQGRRDFHAENSARLESTVDLLTVSDWLKESVVQGPENAGSSSRAGLWDLKGPRRPTFIDENATQIKAASKEETGQTDSVSEAMVVPTTEHKESEPSEPPMLNLLCGQQNTSSRYFTKTCFRVPAFAVPDTPSSSEEEVNSLLQLPELDPNAFRLYLIWLQTGKVLSGYHGAIESSLANLRQYSWQVCWPLMNAHILGYNIKAVDFADQVMDFLRERLSNKTFADVETIKHIFSKDDKDMSNLLKHFVVDQCIDAGAEGLTSLELSSLPLAFAHLMVERSLRRLSIATSASKEAMTDNGCEYHLHDTPDACYKKNIRPSEARKKRWLELGRETARKEAEEVVTNAILNGVKTVDWEKQNVGGNRASIQQFEQTKATCSRVEERQSVQPEAIAKQNREASCTAADGKLKPGMLAGALFGTTQSNGAVDVVLHKAPSRGAPLPPPP